MARKGSEDVAWMPRRLRKLAKVAAAPPVHSSQPKVHRETLAPTAPVPPTPEPQPAPATPQAEFAVLPWAPRVPGSES